MWPEAMLTSVCIHQFHSHEHDSSGTLKAKCPIGLKHELIRCCWPKAKDQFHCDCRISLNQTQNVRLLS